MVLASPVAGIIGVGEPPEPNQHHHEEEQISISDPKTVAYCKAKSIKDHEPGTGLDSLPKDIAAAIESGRTPGSVITWFLELQKSAVMRLLSLGKNCSQMIASWLNSKWNVVLVSSPKFDLSDFLAFLENLSGKYEHGVEKTSSMNLKLC